MSMEQLINQYLISKQWAWAPSTQKSESHRLTAIAGELDGNPERLWRSIQDRGSYTRLTIWTRVADFYDWLIDEGKVKGPNEYKKWRKKNAKVFKNCYQKSKPEISYEEALERIRSIDDEGIRKRALEIIGSGTRYKESGNIDEHGNVCGKGSKVRNVFMPRVVGQDFKGNYQLFRRALAKIGLRPHDLRKLFLSKLVELGANEFELCEIAGWSSIATASSYIKVNSDRTRKLVQLVHGGIKDDNTRSHKDR